MKFLDTLLGKTKPVPANLDKLFALSSAAVTLDASLGLKPSLSGAVCLAPAAARSFDEAFNELKQLTKDDLSNYLISKDSYSYTWVVIKSSEFEDLVTKIHMVNSSIADAGWSAQLLCSVFPFNKTDESPDDWPNVTNLVYLFKRGTFYPFIQTGPQMRDTASEMRLKSCVGDDLEIEQDLSRWFPIWDVNETISQLD